MCFPENDLFNFETFETKAEVKLAVLKKLSSGAIVFNFSYFDIPLIPI